MSSLPWTPSKAAAPSKTAWSIPSPPAALGKATASCSFASGNRILNCDYGVAFGKSQNNLTYGCATPFQNSVDAGGNN